MAPSNYSGTTLTETVKDTVSNASATYNYTVGNLASLLGGGTAFVGFTGETGLVTGPTQTISDFAFVSVPEAAAWGSTVPGILSLLALARLRRGRR